MSEKTGFQELMSQVDGVIFHPLTVFFAWFALACVLVLKSPKSLKLRKLKLWRFSDTWWLNALGWFAVGFAPILIALLLSVLTMLTQVGWRIVSGDTLQPITTPKGIIEDGADNLRWYVLAFVGLLTALAGILGTPLTLIRVWTTERQTNTAEQGLITDRINKAVEGLGAEKNVKRHRQHFKGQLQYEDIKGIDGRLQPNINKPIYEEVTVPNLEVRIGAIFSLERIAQDSLRDHVQIMEIICAYIRSNAQAEDALLSPHEVSDTLSAGNEYEQGLNSEQIFQDKRYNHVNFYEWTPTELTHENLLKWAQERLQAREDIQTALAVLGRRTQSQRAHEHSADYKINLKKTNLQGAVLRGNFDDALFSDSKLDGANLYGSFENAHFGIYAEHALSGATLQGARCDSINATKTDFSGCNLDSVFFGGSTLNKCLFRAAKLDHTNFNGASLVGTDFAFAKPLHVYCNNGANFERSRFYDTKLSEFKGIEEGPSKDLWVESNVNMTQTQEAKFEKRKGNIGELDSRKKWQQWVENVSPNLNPDA
ncbi:pentapeptide repeat-containing protein [Pacificibacter sp. AS14]|uniref:pentapeptide repeat-containing protein n=1 Tax=Pacificibacter sp. AS14 TaxID=3135785 RepID=UPI003175C03D